MAATGTFESLSLLQEQQPRHRAKLDLLEVETLALILEFVDQSSPKTTKSVALTCKYLNSVLKLVAHRHKTVLFELIADPNAEVVIKESSATAAVSGDNSNNNVDDHDDDGDENDGDSHNEDEDDEDEDEDEDEDDDEDENENEDDEDETRWPPPCTFTMADTVRRWVDDPNVLVNLRSLTVDVPRTLPVNQINFLAMQYPKLQEQLDDGKVWMPFVELISKATKLRQLTWNLPSIPIVVLDALRQNHKRATLRMFKFQPSSASNPTKVDRAIAKTPALTHLRSVLAAQNHHPNFQEVAIRRIVALAPSLEYFGLVNRIGDPLAGEPTSKEPFLTSRKPNASIRAITLDGYNISKATLDDWASIIELSRLENVKFSRGFPELDYFQNAATLLPNLKHVSLNFKRANREGEQGAELVAAVQQYLDICSPLETLSLWSWMDIVDLNDLLRKHGSTLKSLHLHMPEVYAKDRTRQCLTVEQIKDILNSCKQLKELTFDLNRSRSKLKLDEADKNIGYFKVLKGGKLDYLQIYFDQGLAFAAGLNPQAMYEFLQDSGSEDEADDQENSCHEVDATENEERAVKKARLSQQPIRATKEIYMKDYVKDIWKMVFNDSGGSRKLDIKFGEWESTIARPSWAQDGPATYGRKYDRHLTAKPAERDDQKHECWLSMKPRPKGPS